MTSNAALRPERAHMLLLCCRLMNVEADQLTYHPHGRTPEMDARANELYELGKTLAEDASRLVADTNRCWNEALAWWFGSES